MLPPPPPPPLLWRLSYLSFSSSCSLQLYSLLLVVVFPQGEVGWWGIVLLWVKLTDLRGCLSAHLYFHGIPFIFKHNCCLVCFTSRSFCVCHKACVCISVGRLLLEFVACVFLCTGIRFSAAPFKLCLWCLVYSDWVCLCRPNKLSQCVCCTVHVSIPVLTREEEMEGEPAHLRFWVALVERQLC